MFKVGDQFETMAAAKAAVTADILNAGQSYWVYKSDPTRYIIICKSKSKECPFKTRITYSQKTELAAITKYEEHTCSPAIHYENPAANGLQHLKVHHRASVIDNNTITPSNYYF